jgi:pimeloyl-ACP methyl ester carboxylesterase
VAGVVSPGNVVTTGEVTVDGIRSPLLQAGPPRAREAVVFVHGNPGCSHDWEDLLGRIGEFGRAVALDMPGFGRADKPAHFDYSVHGYARHLNAALIELGVERAHLVGHDFGGPWALAWAAQQPSAFASAVLISTGVPVGYRWHALARVWRTRLLGELFMATTTRPGFRLLLRRGQAKPLPRPFVDRMYDDFDWGTKRAVLKLYRATDPGMLNTLVPILRGLDRPALVVWGRRDPYMGVQQAELQRHSFPSAEIVVLDHCGHWSFIDDPQRVGDTVIPFLRRQLAA